MTATPDIPSDAEQEQRVPADPLREWATRVLVSKGLGETEAAVGAARLVEADLRGIHSHGTRALSRYCGHIDKGTIRADAEIVTVRETAAIAVLDGGRGLGHVVSTLAMETAIAKAREVGTGTVAVRNSQHFGAASVYSLMAAREGLIGYCTTSTGPATVAAYGSRQGGVANNAFAWGVPSRTGSPIVLDMACAVSSWGKVESLGMYGRPIPAGWALDADGNETTDGKQAKTLQPAAGARGYGLAFVSSVLAGTLVGARMPLFKTGEPAAEGSEHFFYAIDLAGFVDPDEFYNQVDAAVDVIRDLAPADGFDRVRLPGDLEWDRTQAWQADGIPMHRDHVDSLAELAESTGVDVAW